MENRIYGVIGIKSIMANWNADFTGYPKTTSAGDIFGSDKALKYPMKRMWLEDGEKVLYIKTRKVINKKDSTIIAPKTLKERFEEVNDIKDLKKEKDQDKVLSNLFESIDVKQFGATFAEEGNNIGITGAVQIGQGFNKYEDSDSFEQQILSPFADGTAVEKKGEEAKSTTLGTKIASDEAHYVYPFAITPSVYEEYVELGVTDGYTEEDYAKFKEAALVSATAFNTNSKLGCENELAVFVEVDKKCYLPDLAQYVTFEKGEDGKKNVITLGFDKLLKDMKDKVKSIEIYYNPYTTVIEKDVDAKEFNIFTKGAII